MSSPDGAPYRIPHVPRPTPAPGAIQRWLELWFGLRASVSRAAYIKSGLGLALLKYGADAGLVFAVTGRFWSPLSYLAPSITLHIESVGQGAPSWLFLLLGATTLPFLWVGVTMSVRRAADAGRSPWTGFLFLLPGLNYFAILFFALLPSVEKGWSPGARDAPAPSVRMDPGARSAVIAVLANIGEGLVMTLLSVYGLGAYGAVLFFVTPCAMGATAAFLYNPTHRRRLAPTLGVALLGTAFTGLAILLFAVEGIVCLAMAFPIAAALACIGAGVAWAILGSDRPRAMAPGALLLLVPGMAVGESAVLRPSLREVESVIEIDAPPAVVWQNVVGFSELPPPPEWFFRLGVAYPVRARIDGEGVGAVRRCEFSTGPFVEPITRWEPGHRLSFDVVAQPPSMTELSPYRQVRAPHLEGYMVSKRGEFRLIALPGGRTRLEGSTWYTLAIYPEGYWVGYAEGLLHAIHGRVLRHVKALSEAQAGRAE